MTETPKKPDAAGKALASAEKPASADAASKPTDVIANVAKATEEVARKAESVLKDAVAPKAKIAAEPESEDPKVDDADVASELTPPAAPKIPFVMPTPQKQSGWKTMKDAAKGAFDFAAYVPRWAWDFGASFIDTGKSLGKDGGSGLKKLHNWAEKLPWIGTFPWVWTAPVKVADLVISTPLIYAGEAWNVTKIVASKPLEVWDTFKSSYQGRRDVRK